MELLERLLDNFMQEMVDIDREVWLSIWRKHYLCHFHHDQLEEKYIAANKPLYLAFVDLEKAFDREPRKGNKVSGLVVGVWVHLEG